MEELKIDFERVKRVDDVIQVLKALWIGLIVFLILYVCTKTTSNTVWQKKAAQTECAQYHPSTGKFEWIEQ